MPSYVTKEELAAAKRAIDARITALSTRVTELEARVNALPPPAPAPAPSPTPVPAPSPTPAPAPAPIYWGARADGEVYSRPGDAPWDSVTWDTFEAHAGRKVSMIHWGQPFGQLDLNALTIARNRGAVSLVSMDFPTDAVLTTSEDAKIDAFAQRARTFGYPVLLRLGWEMNGGWYGWGRRANYVAAWRKFVSRVRAATSNVSFVWCPNAIWEDPASDPGPYFPGEDFVDWTGIDAYNFNTPWKTPRAAIKPTYDRVLQLAPNRPIALCETASTEAGGSKANWMAELLATALPVDFPRVRAVTWFNWNIFEDGTTRRDWQIESSAAAQAAFAREIASARFRSPAATSPGKLPVP